MRRRSSLRAWILPNWHLSIDVILCCLIFSDTGYAFSGEAGHAPQITDKLLRATTLIMTAQRLLPAIKDKKK